MKSRMAILVAAAFVPLTLACPIAPARAEGSERRQIFENGLVRVKSAHSFAQTIATISGPHPLLASSSRQRPWPNCRTRTFEYADESPGYPGVPPGGPPVGDPLAHATGSLPFALAKRPHASLDHDRSAPACPRY